MILLDTNVLSALMKVVPDKAVLDWLDDQQADEVWTTTISVFEVRNGLVRMPEGRRRQALEEAFQAMLDDDLNGRIASFDLSAAEATARLAARRQAAGRGVDLRDTMIGGIALARRAIVASRNVRHFDDLETGCVNPWT